MVGFTRAGLSRFICASFSTTALFDDFFLLLNALTSKSPVCHRLCSSRTRPRSRPLRYNPGWLLRGSRRSLLIPALRRQELPLSGLPENENRMRHENEFWKERSFNRSLLPLSRHERRQEEVFSLPYCYTHFYLGTGFILERGITPLQISNSGC
jgi:hypothetical protein